MFVRGYENSLLSQVRGNLQQEAPFCLRRRLRRIHLEHRDLFGRHVLGWLLRRGSRVGLWVALPFNYFVTGVSGPFHLWWFFMEALLENTKPAPEGTGFEPKILVDRVGLEPTTR